MSPRIHITKAAPGRAHALREWCRLFAWGAVGCVAGFAPAAMAQTNAAAMPAPTLSSHPKPQHVSLPPLPPPVQTMPRMSKAFVLLPPGGDDWTRHFQMGAVMALNISAKFHESGTFGINGSNPGQGIYDDGYVRTDQTGNAGGFTSYWGYHSASQYDAVNQTLSFHSASSFTASGQNDRSGDPSFGLDLVYGDDIAYFTPAHMRIGWELGFGFLPINVTDESQLIGTVNQSTYVYDASGLYPRVPGAPYNGGSSGLGPLLPGQTVGPPSTQQFANGVISGKRSLDMSLFTLRLGPSFFWEISPNLGLSLSGGPVVGWVTGNYEFDETVMVNGIGAHNAGNFGDTAVMYGGYVNAMLKYHITDNDRNAYLFLGAQYEPLSKSTFSNGGRSAELDLSKQVYISAGIGWPF
jgi:hypothetical protein